MSLKKIQKTIKQNKIIVLLIALFLFYAVKFHYYEYTAGNKKGFYITFLGFTVFQFDLKNNKIVTLILFGCGFQRLSFDRIFIFNREVWNNELETLEGK